MFSDNILSAQQRNSLVSVWPSGWLAVLRLLPCSLIEDARYCVRTGRHYGDQRTAQLPCHLNASPTRPSLSAPWLDVEGDLLTV